MHDRMLHRGRKHVCGYCLQAFSTKEILKQHINDCFKINNKKRIKMLKKGEYVKFINDGRKVKSPFTIEAVFQCQKIMESKIRMSLIRANVKNMLLAVMVINQCVLKINLVNFLIHTWVEMLFTILLTAWSKKAINVVM